MIDLELETLFDQLRESDHRSAAEVAYVLARLSLNAGNKDDAAKFGAESIRLFDQCKMDTIEECAAKYVTLGGIALPSYIHQDVVRARLVPLKL